jgi:hypothetical protein
MSNFREKAQVFIIGLSIGLLIAGAFFILKLDDYFKELSLYKKVSQTFSSPAINLESSEKNTASGKKEKKNQKGSKNKNSSFSDSVIVQKKGSEQKAFPDTLKQKNDSLTLTGPATEEIVVRKDELLATKTFEVNNLSPVAKLSAKDSLVQKVSGIKDDKFNGRQMFNIELWSSPLNYKGYKMSKYKMVLYGIPSLDGIHLYKLDDIIYLKTGSLVYRLDYASDFKQYERITDEQIITKLK